VLKRQYGADGGWMACEGNDDLTLEIVADQENAKYEWRVPVTVVSQLG